MRAVDIRARLAAFVSIVAVIVLTRSPAGAAAAVLAVALIGLVFGARRALAESIKPLVPMVVVVALISLIFFDWREGLATGLRFAGLLALGVVFFATSSARELGRGLLRLRVPYPAVFVAITGLNYVPLIKGRLRDIADAQRARGIAVGFRPSELKNLPALLSPALIHSFVLADELAMAMEARGFSRSERREPPAKRLKITDWLVVALSGAILVIKAVLIWLPHP